MNESQKESTIFLRKLKIKDKQALVKLLNNKKIWNNLRDHLPYPYSERDAESFIESTEKDKHQHVFAIEYNGSFCGVIGLTLQKDVYRRSAEIGYWIGEPFWGKGIATKSIQWITRYGFENLKLLRIYACVFESNPASMKVLEKNGYINEGILKKAVIKNGKIQDEYRYYRLNPSVKDQDPV